MKYDASGTQVWIARYSRGSGDGSSFPSAIVVDAAGNVYVTGYPVIALVNPPSSEASSPTTRLAGKISNREGIIRVEILRNGIKMKKLEYEQKPQEVNLRLDVPLEEGSNSIQVVAYGEKRQHAEQIEVAFKPLAPTPFIFPTNLPTITIFSPLERAISNSFVRLEFEIGNIDSSTEVRIKVNGNRLEETGNLFQERVDKRIKGRKDIDLREGLNRLEVQASNHQGLKSQELEIFYNPLIADVALSQNVGHYHRYQQIPESFAGFTPVGCW